MIFRVVQYRVRVYLRYHRGPSIVFVQLSGTMKRGIHHILIYVDFFVIMTYVELLLFELALGCHLPVSPVVAPFS